MKRLITILLILLVAFSFATRVNAAEETRKNNSGKLEPVTKTYTLKYVKPDRVHRALRQYVWEASYDRNGTLLTVKMRAENVATFEKLLNQLDVERKRVMLRIFTVIASHDKKGVEIKDGELKKVMGELQKLLNFKSFHLDGMSAITLTDGQRHSTLTLASQLSLKLSFGDVSIRKGKDNKLNIGFEFELRKYGDTHVQDGKLLKDSDTLIESETSVKEDGYLVAGVSKLGKNGDSLVLVIHAEMK